MRLVFDLTMVFLIACVLKAVIVGIGFLFSVLLF